MDRSPSTQRGKVGEAKSDHFVAFPAAESHRANVQFLSCLRLVQFQLEAAPPEMAAKRRQKGVSPGYCRIVIEKVLPLLVFAAGGVAVIQDVQTLQRQHLTFLVDRFQVANSQHRIDQDPPVGLIVAGSNPRNSMMRRRWNSVARFWFFSHFSIAVSVIPSPD